MKFLVIIPFVLTPIIAISQDLLEKSMSEDVCECIAKAKMVADDILPTCFSLAVQNNQAIIKERALSKYKILSDSAAFKITKPIFDRLFITTIATCDSYFLLMDTARFTAFKKLDQDSLKLMINRLNIMNEQKRDKEFFTERGKLYFKTKNYAKALADLNMALQFDESVYMTLFFKAWALEMLGNYDEAYLLFLEVGKKSKKDIPYVHAAIVARKKSQL